MSPRQRLHLTTALAVLAAAIAVPAPAAAEEPDDSDVRVTVDIAGQPGVLALTVAGDAVVLTENGSTLLVRKFTGSLPTVTVTDTRTAGQVPAGASWAVLGTATDFTGTAGQPSITANHFGWRPRLIDGGTTGLVTEGEEVVTVLDPPTQPGNNVGLQDQELLISTYDSAAVAAGAYTVGADLYLHTPADVAPGQYASTLTLSLFE